MLNIKATLPAGALLGQAGDAFGHSISSDALWLRGAPENFDMDDDGIIRAWNTQNHSATPVEPNAGNTKFQDTGRTGMICQSEVHCGLVVPKVTDFAAHCSMAVIYTPDPNAETGTLLTLSTYYTTTGKKRANYLFIMHRNDQVTVKDTNDSISIETATTLNPGRAHMIVVTLSGHQLAVAQNLANPVETAGLDPNLASPADLFIGCRNHRPGLLKSLGQSVVHDVLFWPRQSLLMPSTDAERAQHTALKRYYLWQHGSK